MLMQAIFFVIVAVLGNVTSTSVSFKPCGSSKQVTPTKVELSPCPEQPCKFHHGETVDVKITFKASQAETHLKAAIHGIVFGLPIGWPMPNSDGCNEQGISCPVVQGDEYTYHASFKVLNYYPKIKLTVMWQLDGDSNQFCFKFPMSIVDGKPYDETVIG